MSRLKFLVVCFATVLIMATYAHASGGAISPIKSKNNFLVLAIGDSTTAGTPGFESPAEKPPVGSGDETSQYAYWIMKSHPDWNVVNRGIAGQRTDQILKRLKKEIDHYQPEVVIILAGVNDVYQNVDLKKIKDNLWDMYEIAIKSGCRLVTCSILPYNTAGEKERKKVLELNQWIKRHSDLNDILFCDTFKVVRDPAEPFYLKDSPDGIHPSPQGYERMGEALVKILEKAI